MCYTIGFGMNNKQDAATVEVPTAIEAVALVETLKEIKFIRSPQEGEIGIASGVGERRRRRDASRANCRC